MYGTGNYSVPEECARNCKEFVPEGVETVIVDVDNDEVPCFGTDEDDCKYNFVYYYNETNCLQVRAQNERECPPQVYMLGIVLGVIAAVVLIGLALLLLWKLLTTIHDRREFARFEKERMMAKWDTVRISNIINHNQIELLRIKLLKSIFIKNRNLEYQNKFVVIFFEKV